jgi:O-antigen/teichoic acid export membrane protein
MSVSQRLTYNMAFAVAGRVASALIGLATTAMMTRHLGPELFGVYRTASAWAVLGCTLANLGLSMVTLREIAVPGRDAARTVGTALTVRVVLGLGSVALTSLLLALIPSPDPGHAHQLVLATAVAGLGSVATLGNEIVTTIFQNALAQAKATIAELAGGLAMLAGVTLAVTLDGGLIHIVAASTAGLLTTFVVSAVLADSIKPVRFYFDPGIARMLIVLGLPVFLSEALGMITLRLDTVTLSLLSTPPEVAFYGVASKLREIGSKIPFMFGAFLLPVFVRLADQPLMFEKRVADALLATWIFSVAGMLALGCFAGELVAGIAGGSFAPAATCVQVSGLALAATSLVAILNAAALAMNRAHGIVKNHLVGAVVTLGGFAILIPLLGAVGAALAVAAGEVVFMVTMLFLAGIKGLPQLPWRKFAGVGAVGSVTAAAVMGGRAIELPGYVLMFAAAVVYPVLLVLTGLLDPAQLRGLIRRPRAGGPGVSSEL